MFILPVLLICTLCLSVNTYADIKRPDHYFRVATQMGDKSAHVPVKYFFWSAGTEADKAIILTYERKLYNSAKWYSINLGSNVGKAYVGNEEFSIFSVYANHRFWLLDFKHINIFINASAGGLTSLSIREINNRKLGSELIFQDFIGLGISMAKKYKIEIALQFYHYSNANIFNENPGLDIPATINISMSI